MRRRRFRLLPMILVCSSLLCSAKVHPASALDAEYVSALATADHFMQAWQSGDAESGIALLTGHAKKNENMNDLEKFFSAADPSAYEIDRGKRVKHGRYEFPIVLVSRSSQTVHRKFSSIIVINTGNNDWAVDKLP